MANKKSSNRLRWAFAIGAFIILFALIFLGHPRKQGQNPPPNTTSSQTAGWKTYTNSDYYFSFQYPSYFTKTIDKLPKKPTGIVKDSLRLINETNQNEFQLYVNPQFGGMCHGKLIYNAAQSGEGLTFSKTKGNNSALPAGAKCSTFYEARINLDNGNYLFTTFSYDEKDKNPQADFEKILSTFKFTK